MRMYLVAGAAGLLLGVIYGLLGVRSPAPPVVALVGLLGILLGEQLVPVARRVLAGAPVTLSWARGECVPHVFGTLPTGGQDAAGTPGRRQPRADA